MSQPKGGPNPAGVRTAETGGAVQKSATGIAGFDALSDGGLPQGRSTLVAGTAGAGKTVFALQLLAEGGLKADEAGIFVTFEEPPERVRGYGMGFGWAPAALNADHISGTGIIRNLTSVNIDLQPHVVVGRLKFMSLYAESASPQEHAYAILTIVKSRGTGHSRQVRELILTDNGVSLTDVYYLEGELLLGTARWDHERRERESRAARQRGLEFRRQQLRRFEDETKARTEALQHELELRRAELLYQQEADAEQLTDWDSGDEQRTRRRGREAKN